MDILLKAVLDGDVEKVRYELKIHPQKVTMHYGNGQTLLSCAAELGHLDIVKILIKNNAEINVTGDTSLKETPLQNAVLEDYSDIVEVLLENGADVSIEDNNGNTALHILANTKAVGLWNEKSEKILKMLLRYGAKIETVPIAAAFGTLQDVQRIVEEGADIDESLEYSERNALHIAAEENNIKLLTYLVDIFEYVNHTDFNSLTPLDIAKTKEAKTVLRDNGGKTMDEMEDEIYGAFASKDAAIRLIDKIKKSNQSTQSDSQDKCWPIKSGGGNLTS